MKTFITGGTGFIGTHLVRRLTQTGHEMVCLTRGTSDISTLEEVGATCVRRDVTDKDSLTRGLHLVMIYPGAALGPEDLKASGQCIQGLILHQTPATVFHDTVLT